MNVGSIDGLHISTDMEEVVVVVGFEVMRYYSESQYIVPCLIFQPWASNPSYFLLVSITPCPGTDGIRTQRESHGEAIARTVGIRVWNSAGEEMPG